MGRRRALLAASAALALFALGGCATTRSARGPGTLAGVATYREPIGLPPDARLEAQLLDTTDPDVAAPVVAEQLVDRPGQVPIAFVVTYDPKRIDPTRTYALRVRIRVGDDIWFASPVDVRVLTVGNPTQRVEVMLDRISAGGPGARTASRQPDPDPPNLDPRVKAVRDEARAIDARLDRFYMREVMQGPERLQLWMSDGQPVKLVVSDAADPASLLSRASSYYLRDGRLFWVRSPGAGFVVENGVVVLRTDARLQPLDAPRSAEMQQREAHIQQDFQLRLSTFGVD